MSDPDLVSRSDHVAALALSCAVLAAAFVLDAPRTPDGPVTVTVGSWRLNAPVLCPSKRFLGVSCPGCGLTRSFVASAKGEYSAALVYNPLGPMVFLLCIAQIPYRLMELGRWGTDSKLWAVVRKMGRFAPALVLCGLFLQWAWRFIP